MWCMVRFTVRKVACRSKECLHISVDYTTNQIDSNLFFFLLSEFSQKVKLGNIFLLKRIRAIRNPFWRSFWLLLVAKRTNWGCILNNSVFYVYVQLCLSCASTFVSAPFTITCFTSRKWSFSDRVLCAGFLCFRCCFILFEIVPTLRLKTRNTNVTYLTGIKKWSNAKNIFSELKW